MSKALLAVLAAATFAAVLAPAASAAPTTLDYFLARDACGGSVAQNLHLDVDPGSYSGSCGSVTGIAGDSTYSFPATGGVPVTIDGTRPVDIYIGLNSFTGPPLGGIGDQTVTVELLGRTATQSRVRMGQATQTVAAQDMLRNGGYSAEFQLPVPGDTYTGLTLNLTVGGSEFQGYVNYQTSGLTVPLAPTP